MQVTLPGRGGPAGGLFLQVLIPETGPVAERLRVREIDDDEGRRLVRIIRRGSGSVVTWRRAQMVLLSAQGMDVPAIAKVAFTSEDRVRDVIRNFNADGFGSLYPKYKAGHPPKFTLGQRREIKKIAKSKPAEHDLPFSTWSLAKLADFLVAEGVVDDISHEGLRVLLREQGVTFQRLKTWKASKDPRYAEKKARVEQLYAIADREVTPQPGDPEMIFCVDEFGPLNLQPRPGRQWAAVSGKGKEPGRAPRPRMVIRRRTHLGKCSPSSCSPGGDQSGCPAPANREVTQRARSSSSMNCLSAVQLGWPCSRAMASCASFRAGNSPAARRRRASSFR